MDLDRRRQPLDAPGIPEVDGELASHVGRDGQVQVEVIEHLRVKVPAAARQAWLEAEAASWEPWLAAQVGFLGRELRWDAEREEGQLLISWASREQWHAIPRAEIEQVQERFERLAHAALERLGVVFPPDADPQGNADATHSAQATASPVPGVPVNAVPNSVVHRVAVPPSAGMPQVTPPNPFPLVFAGELAPDGLLTSAPVPAWPDSDAPDRLGSDPLASDRFTADGFAADRVELDVLAPDPVGLEPRAATTGKPL